jgi:hypothetical protein
VDYGEIRQRIGALEASLEELRGTVQGLNAAVANLRAEFDRLTAQPQG